MPLIDLNHLRVFERVAAHGSFSAAARELGLPRSNVSRAVSKLEEVSGTRLMQRTTRAVTLTAAGAALQERASAIMRDLDAALHVLEDLSGSPSGPLKISAGIGVGINVLGDALPEFIERYPQVRVELQLEGTRVDLVAENIDVALRFGELPDSTLVAQKLGVLDRVICAAPAYFAGRTRPERPEDLAAHRIIDMPPPDGRSRVWTLGSGDRLASVNLAPAVVVDDVLTIHRIVRGGAGIGILSAYLVDEDLAKGVVEPVLPGWTVPAVPLSLVYPSRRELAPAVRAFTDFMREIEPRAPWRK